jgi:Na+-driven multidrug efflux pump
MGSGTMFVLMQAGAALRAAGSGRAPAALLVGANLLNAVLSWALVFGEFGLPELGVVGTAWGTIIARGIFAVIALGLLAGPYDVRWRGPGPHWITQARLLRLGLPAAGQWLVRLGAVLVVLAVVGRSGAAAQAGFGIGGRLDTLAIFATVGWGAAAATATGQGLGARDPAGASRAAWFAALLGFVTMAAAALVYFLQAPELMDVFARSDADSAVIRDFGAGYLRVVVLGYPAVGLAIVLSLGLTGAGSVRTALIVDFIVLIGVQVPVVLLVAPEAGGDPTPIWWALAGTHWLLAAVYVVVFRRGRWKLATT